MATATERLATISAAIDALINGGAQSYSIGSRSVTKFDLPELVRLEQELRGYADREVNGMFTLAKMGRKR